MYYFLQLRHFRCKLVPMMVLNCFNPKTVFWTNVGKIVLIYFRAVQKLIAINRIQNKSLCLHNIFVCAVYDYFV